MKTVKMKTVKTTKKKTIIREEEGHYIMIKGQMKEEDITIVNIYTTRIGAPLYIKQVLAP